MKKKILTLMLLASCLVPGGGASLRAQTLDFFSGVNLDFRNLFQNERPYDVNLELTPGVKWNMGNYWVFAAQAIVPIKADYAASNVRLNMATVSKEFSLGNYNFFKISAGLFSNERYGVDLKWMCPINDWFAFDVQLGYTGYMSMAGGWRFTRPDRLSGWARARFYLWKSDTEFIGKFGRFAYGDLGVEVEWLKHFKHTSIGLYGQYDNVSDFNLGIRITVSVPGSWRAGKKVGVRPASNFTFNQAYLAKSHTMTTYATDPEENSRDGYFTIEGSGWGIKDSRK